MELKFPEISAVAACGDRQRFQRITLRLTTEKSVALIWISFVLPDIFKEKRNKLDFPPKNQTWAGNILLSSNLNWWSGKFNPVDAIVIKSLKLLENETNLGQLNIYSFDGRSWRIADGLVSESDEEQGAYWETDFDRRKSPHQWPNMLSDGHFDFDWPEPVKETRTRQWAENQAPPVGGESSSAANRFVALNRVMTKVSAKYAVTVWFSIQIRLTFEPSRSLFSLMKITTDSCRIADSRSH